MKSRHLFARHSRHDYPVAVGGDGCFLIDQQGKRYLDASCGAAVSCLGHSDSTVRAAIHDQIDNLAFAHTGFFTNDPAERLATRLADLAPDGLNRVYIVSSGSEAIEASIKLARQYFTETGQPSRHRVIARRQSYHGNTLGALGAGGNQWRRRQFEPLLCASSLIAPCYAYRDKGDDESDEAYGLRVAQELEAEILAVGSESVMAFLAEPVVGATAGAVPAVPGYFRKIRDICDKYGILLILDEVMCGMGRTGTLFACEADQVIPDIVVIAKGLGAGYQPIGAMICQDYIHDHIEQGSGFFQHGHTYLGHPMACATALAVLGRLVDDKIAEGVTGKSAQLRAKLDAAFGQHPHIGDLRGRGLFLGIELVADRHSKQSFAPSLNIAGAIKQNAMDAGLMVYPSQGTIDGKHGDHVLIAPPFIITEDEMDLLVDRLHTAINNSIEECQTPV
ncbi:MAG: aspartate aminotransferase family protein [Candidatus Puniceispirillum sp.]